MIGSVKSSITGLGNAARKSFKFDSVLFSLSE